MLLKKTLVVAAILICYYSQGQFLEDFSDGDFTSDPIWNGNTNQFVIDDDQLRSNNDPDAGGIGEYYLSTPSEAAYNASWELYFNLDFPTSGANYVDIYLIADREDLTQVNFGYFVRIGGTDDEIVLYKKINGSTIPIIEEPAGDDLVDKSSNNTFNIRVTRSPEDLWVLEADKGAIGTYLQIGTVIDSDIVNSNYFGIRVIQSSADAAVNSHYFDDIDVSGTDYPDLIPPSITHFDFVSSDSLIISFSERLNRAEAEISSNYSFGEGFSILGADLSNDSTSVILSHDGFTNGGVYELEISNLEDLSGNVLADTLLALEYILTAKAQFRNVTINEFITDPDIITDIPTAEFIEILNTTDQFFDLTNWIIKDNIGTSSAFPNVTLRPDSLLIICERQDSVQFATYGDIVVLDDLPNLNASSPDQVLLLDQAGDTIDLVVFTESPVDGVSFEQINPFHQCGGVENFQRSVSQMGGTPGAENSVFDDTADTLAPGLVEWEIVRADSLVLEFDESIKRIDASLIDVDGIGIKHYSFEHRTISLTLNSALDQEQFVSIEFERVEDCTGNSQRQIDSLYFDERSPQFFGLEYISPKVLSIQFHEPLYPSSAERESNFSIDSFSPTRAILQDSALNKVHLTFESSFLEGRDYWLYFENMADTIGNISSRDSISFTYADEVDSVLVISERIIAVDYEVAPTNLDLSNFYVDQGIGNPVSILRDKADASVIRLSFSKSFDDNEEYLLYSFNLKSEKGSVIHTPAKAFIWDTRPPSILFAEVLSDSTLTIKFSEPVNMRSQRVNNFELGEWGNPETIQFLEPDSIVLIYDSLFVQEREMTLLVSDVEDLWGNTMKGTKRISLVFDQRPPQVEYVMLADNNRIRILANEPLQTPDKSWFEIEDSKAVMVEMIGPDSTSFMLHFEEEIANQVSTELNIMNWEDLKGNGLLEPVSYHFNSQNPVIANLEIINDRVIEVSYSRPMDASVGILDNYKLSFLLKSVQQLDEYRIQLTTDQTLLPDSSYQFETVSVRSVDGHSLSVGPLDVFTFTDYIDRVEIVDSLAIRVVFETELSLPDTLSFQLHQTPKLISLSENNRELVLLFDDPIIANTYYSFEIKGVIDRYGRRIPDQQIPVIKDTQGPRLISIRSDFKSTLMLEFDEAIDEESIESLDQFELNDQVNPTDFTVQNENLMIKFERLVPNLSYQLKVTGLSDLKGNIQSTDTLSFVYKPPLLAQPGEVRITEIMADPTPSAGLPEIEFVEIVYIGNDSLNLAGLSISDRSTAVELSDHWLDSGEYVVLAEGDLDIENSICVNLPILDNGGDSISILNLDGHLIDYVSYHRDWYSTEEGGHSLELINLLEKCRPDQNWKESIDSLGGTPGRKNSVYDLSPDSTPPRILESSLITGSMINYHFNEMIDSMSTVSIKSPELITDFSFIDPFTLSVSLDGLDSGVMYTLVLEGVRDCPGNRMLADTLVFGISMKSKPGEILISEIMADPSPAVGLHEVEYVELINVSDFGINLNTLTFGDKSESVNLPDYWLGGGEYVVLTEIDLGVENQAILNLPPLDNSGDSISITNDSGVLIDAVKFELRAEDGVSFERSFIENTCPEKEKWGYSIAELGGTPGAQNSLYSMKLDSIAPFLSDYELMSDTVLRLVFSEEFELAPEYRLDSLTLMGDISVEQLIAMPSFYDGYFRHLSVHDGSDCWGNVMKSDSIVLGFGTTPAPGDLVISEIMSDPTPSRGLPEVEYVEIYNTTNQLLSIGEVVLADENDSVALSGVIQPKSYLILAPASQSFQFQKSLGISPWLNLVNSQGQITLSVDSIELDGVLYNKEWLEDTYRDGGYSIEKIELDNTCFGIENWRPSEIGGTPGAQNNISGTVEQKAVEILDFERSDENLAITLSTSIDQTELEITINNILVDWTYSKWLHGISVPDHQLETNANHMLRLTGEDCRGDSFEVAQEFVIPDIAQAGLVINEVLFNPYSGGDDFIELYNNTDKYLSLDGVIIRNHLGSSKEIEEDVMLAPTTYIVLTADKEQLRFNYPSSDHSNILEMTLPSLPDEEGAVSIVGVDGLQIDSMYYLEGYHSTLLQELDGVSLERLSAGSPSLLKDNWRSASGLAGYATPGFKNSQERGSTMEDAVTIDPHVFVPGSSNPAFSSFTTINFQFAQPDLYANVNVYDASGRIIRRLEQNQLLSTEGFVIWDGTDSSGAAVNTGAYMIIFELYGPNGFKEVIRNSVVVGFKD
ncbi:MAG: lamin tail domain-containing protein [Cyclobacteriaceae bacterium]